MFKRTQEEWKQICLNWQNSGETQEAWCKRNGIPYGSFCVKKIAILGSTRYKDSKKTAAARTSFVQFSPTNSSKIEICLNGSGAKVCIDRNDKEALNTVLATLMSLEATTEK
jgi:hypothetical protein